MENQVWHFDFLYKVNRGKKFIIIIKKDLYSEYFFSPSILLHVLYFMNEK